MRTNSWLHGLQNNFLAQAKAGLASLVRRIAKDDPQTAERIGHALIDRVASPKNFPLLRAPCPQRHGVGKLVSRPCVIF